MTRLTQPPAACPACGAKKNGGPDNDENVILYQCAAVFVREIFDDPKSEYVPHIARYCKNSFDVAVKLRKGLLDLHTQVGESGFISQRALLQEMIRKLLSD